jgi:hypothetical protein
MASALRNVIGSSLTVSLFRPDEIHDKLLGRGKASVPARTKIALQ